MSKTKPSPKRLSDWKPFELHEKVAAWMKDNRGVRLEPDQERGGYVMLRKIGAKQQKEKGTTEPWAEVAHYASLKDFALAQGIIEARDG